LLRERMVFERLFEAERRGSERAVDWNPSVLHSQAEEDAVVVDQCDGVVAREWVPSSVMYRNVGRRHSSPVLDDALKRGSDCSLDDSKSMMMVGMMVLLLRRIDSSQVHHVLPIRSQSLPKYQGDSVASFSQPMVLWW